MSIPIVSVWAMVNVFSIYSNFFMKVRVVNFTNLDNWL